VFARYFVVPVNPTTERVGDICQAVSVAGNVGIRTVGFHRDGFQQGLANRMTVFISALPSKVVLRLEQAGKDGETR
jgi:hypothetical protein